MTGPFSANRLWAQRRADEFDALLSRGAEAPLTERDAQHFAALLAVVSDLRALPEVTARPEFVGSLRERLMVEADTVLLPQATSHQRLALPTRSRKRDRRVAVLLGGAALVGATATVAVAAQNALPGESLYSVKRGIEAAELRFAGDDAARGRTLLANAETRLVELEALAQRDDRSAERMFPDTLDAFTDQSSEGVRSLLTAYAQSGSEEDVARAREFTADSIDRLSALESQVPASARDELVSAGRTLTDLDLEADIACPSCGGGIETTPDFLLSSAPMDLLSGLDMDDLTLEAAPVSGQDLSGITIPEALQTPGSLPTTNVTPTTTPTLPVESPTSTPTKGVDDIVKETGETVTGTTGDLTNTLDEVTGGAIGGLTTGLDDATGGLIGDVTGTLDQVTGDTVSDATGNVLP
jgi:hypothetical protein